MWFKNQLLGREEVLQPLLRASLSVSRLEYLQGTQVDKIVFTNVSDVNFNLRYEGDYTFLENANRITIPANSSLPVHVRTEKNLDQIQLSFSVENALTAPRNQARMVFDVFRDNVPE